MQPGTFHAVLTIRDSVSTGHMFFLPTQLTRTFFTMVQIHLDGQRISNSDYRGAQLGLFRLAAYYSTVLQHAGIATDSAVGREWSEEDESIYAKLQSRSEETQTHQTDVYEKNLRVPPLQDLAALVTIVLHSEDLTPQQEEGVPVKPYPSGYKHDRELGKRHAQLLLDRVINRRISGFYEQLVIHLEEACKSTSHRNRHQRDLPEVGEPISNSGYFISRDPSDPGFFTATFLHDNEHEMRTRPLFGPWDGPQPTLPKSKSKKRRRDEKGREEELEWSEGEPFPALPHDLNVVMES
jgi:hypothetical protein